MGVGRGRNCNLSFPTERMVSGRRFIVAVVAAAAAALVLVSLLFLNTPSTITTIAKQFYV